MTSYAHLEIGLHRRDVGSYTMELRYTPPEGDVDIRLVRRGLSPLNLDFQKLRSKAADPDAYGRLLTEALFSDAEMRAAFAKARTAAQAAGGPLRMRLFVGPSAPELHTTPERVRTVSKPGCQVRSSRALLCDELEYWLLVRVSECIAWLSLQEGL